MSISNVHHRIPTGRSDADDTLSEQMRRMAGGFATTQILHAAAQMGIADHVGEGGCSVDALAVKLDVDNAALYRFMRMMVVLDLLTLSEDGRFALSSLGALLREDHPEGLRDRILYIGSINYPTSQAISHSIRTGKPAFDHVFGEPFFDHLSSRPDLAGIFNGLMQRSMVQRAAAIINAYDFGAASTIVDIAGGNGTLMSAILELTPEAVGIVFDTPEVVAETRRTRMSELDASRMGLLAGDLFDGPYPAGQDLYLMSNVIHDWADEKANVILANCRRAARADSRLLLIEEMMPERVNESPSTVANDFSMLLLTGGKERTESEYRALLGTGGFQLVRTIPFCIRSSDVRRAGNWAILECTPSAHVTYL